MRSLRSLPPSLAIMLVFALHALVVGSLYSRLAEIQKGLALSEDVFGLCLIGPPAGVFFGSPLVGRFVERFGPRRILLSLLPAFAASLLLVSRATGPVTLFAALFLQGALLTFTNIAMNVEADRIEAATGRRVMNRCHGSWGLGFLVASSAGAVAIAAGISPGAHFVDLLVVMMWAAFAMVRPMTESPPRRHARSGAARWVAMPNLATFLIVGYAIPGVWLEGASRNWSIIYLRDAFGAAEWLAALALPALLSTQTLGRFLAEGWIRRFGVVPVSLALTLLASAGLALVAFAGSTIVALAGFALVGLGISIVHPQAISATARWGDRPASENVAAFSSVQTLIVFASPPLFGLIAARLGLHAAFLLILPLQLLALYFARYLEPREGSGSNPQA